MQLLCTHVYCIALCVCIGSMYAQYHVNDQSVYVYMYALHMEGLGTVYKWCVHVCGYMGVICLSVCVYKERV